jgi:hypothetical protein
MPTVIKLKRGTSTPTTSDIVSGEVAVDTSAQRIYINDSGTIKTIGDGAGTFQNFEIKNTSGTTIKIKVGLGSGTTTLIKNSAGTTLNTVVGPFLNATKLVSGLSLEASDQPQQVLIKNASGATLKIRVGLNSGGSTVRIQDSAGTALKTLVGSFVDGSATF